MIQLDTRSENHVCIANTTEKSALVIKQDEDFHLNIISIFSKKYKWQENIVTNAKMIDSVADNIKSQFRR